MTTSTQKLLFVAYFDSAQAKKLVSMSCFLDLVLHGL